MEKKKDYGLLKFVFIAFLLYAVLTWFIPTGNFSGGEFVKGDIVPVGLYGMFTAPIYSFAVFIQYFVLILCVGGFYGVLNKTSVYQKIVDFFASKNKNIFLVICIVINALIASVFGETIMIFILAPFFIAVLLKMGYDKLSCLACTIGASLVGMIASTCGNMAIYKNYFNLDPKVFLIFNIILFFILVFLLSTFVIAKNTNNKKTKAIQASIIPLYESSKSNKKSLVPMIIVLVMVLLLFILGLYNWYYSFNVDIFNNIHEKITSFQLFNTSIISRIFGELSAIGYFTNYDVCAVLVISSAVLAWIYSVSFKDFIDGFKVGAKQMLLPGIYVVFASSIFSSIVTNNTGNISLTISNSVLGLSNDFNIATGSLTGILASFFYNDYLYLMNGLYGIVSLYNANMMPLILSVFQSMFGLMMFILPVSITLIYGLKYLEISYKDWFKYIWKFLVQIFAIILIGSIILSMLV